jgi:hypothetical protein
MNAMTKAFAKHKAAYDERQRLSGTDEFIDAVSKSDQLLLKLAKTPCESDEEFFVKLAHIAEIEFKDYGDPEGRDFESLVIAVRSYLAQRRGQ